MPLRDYEAIEVVLAAVDPRDLRYLRDELRRRIPRRERQVYGRNSSLREKAGEYAYGWLARHHYDLRAFDYFARIDTFYEDLGRVFVD